MTINKSVSINATSQTTDGQAIAYFSANVSDSGTSSNMTIQNQDLYEANKLQVRKDKTDFDNAVYGVEDEQASKATTEG
ncbi:hypothetical protein VPH57_07400 [Leuconostoc mesenteroides]|uniref:hypothetical protein n=1 Tax=Leuconostoc mesenteroides TaxID=1245 RepID=UPI0021E596B7|nr:hypothetical protein [Leuconostoc mesenteroides]MCV2530120.1 hypothetical protein [Leuconostoc mesenteroides]WVI89974.1 hypothetical protein VPH57_07400 [Leuconostoc mesenteroides]